MVYCRLCHYNKLEQKYPLKGFTMDRCKNCDFVQVNEKPAEKDLLKTYSKKYFNHGKYSDFSSMRKENERRLKFIKEQKVRENARILDFGCATGDFINHGAKEFDMWGLDISEFAIDEAKAKNPGIAHQIQGGFLEGKAYCENFFDAVVLWDVIEHLWDPVDTCEKLIKFLKPEGYIFISTPNIGSLASHIMKKYWIFMTVPEHLGFFSRKTLNYLFEKRLNLKMVKWMAKGKWVNFGFILYKIKRIFPKLMPNFAINIFRKRFFNKIALYIPGGDIQYVVFQKSQMSSIVGRG